MSRGILARSSALRCLAGAQSAVSFNNAPRKLPVFKNVMVFRIGPDWSLPVDEAHNRLDAFRFVPCGLSQEQSSGWVEPRGDANGALVESIGGQWIMKFMVEARVLPGAVVKRKVDEQAAQIEATTGRKPGKKEIRDLRDNARLELLPMAFTKQSSVTVWIDPAARWLVVDAGSSARGDAVVTALVEAFAGLVVLPLQTKISPAAAMSHWLTTQEPPYRFTVDRECELKAADESKAVVRYSRHPLDIEEVCQHIAAGKLPTRLAMTWNDRVSLLLTDNLQLKKISFLDVVFEGGAKNGKDDSGFDADAAIATGELEKMLPDLIEALDGEMTLAG